MRAPPLLPFLCCRGCTFASWVGISTRRAGPHVLLPQEDNENAVGAALGGNSCVMTDRCFWSKLDPIWQGITHRTLFWLPADTLVGSVLFLALFLRSLPYKQHGLFFFLFFPHLPVGSVPSTVPTVIVSTSLFTSVSSTLVAVPLQTRDLTFDTRVAPLIYRHGDPCLGQANPSCYTGPTRLRCPNPLLPFLPPDSPRLQL